MHYADIKECDIANGPGVRVSVFVSGCNHHCKGCFNKCAWDFNYGENYTEEFGMLVYEKEGMKLKFIITDDEITSIEYTSNVLDTEE